MKDPIITILVIIALSALSNWFKRMGKNGEKEEMDVPPPAPLDPRKPEQSGRRPASRNAGAPAEDWEREIRRLFDMAEPPNQPPPAPAPTPAPATRPTPRPVPPRQSSRTIVSKPPPVPRLVKANPMEEGDPDLDEGPNRNPSRLVVSAQSQARARDLGGRVAERMRDVDQKTTHHVTGTPRSRFQHRDPVSASASLRDPVRLREALVASVILGPPKSLES